MDSHKTDFFIIGAMKAGTTTLNDYLSLHPKIQISEPKEPGYFSRDERFNKGIEWYKAHFQKGKSLDTLLCDASTCYSRNLTFPNTIERLYEHNPDAKFIYVIREPVQRAISHYKHRMEENRINNLPIINMSDFLKNDIEILEAGNYNLQMDLYLRYFKLDQFLIIDFEDLITNPKFILGEVCDFLGVDIITPSLVHANESGKELARNNAISFIRRIRHLPILSAVVDLLPSNARTAALNQIVVSFERSYFGKYIKRAHSNNLPEITTENRAYLHQYYADLPKIKNYKCPKEK